MHGKMHIVVSALFLSLVLPSLAAVTLDVTDKGIILLSVLFLHTMNPCALNLAGYFWIAGGETITSHFVLDSISSLRHFIFPNPKRQ
jgi:hypothetical protein